MFKNFIVFVKCPVKNEREWEEPQEPRMKKTTTVQTVLCMQLLRASERGEAERVKELLLIDGVDVHFRERDDWLGPKTALRLACEKGHTNVVCVLLEHGGETQGELESAFLGAVREGRVEV